MNSEQILALPLEKKIGQLFFIGLPGADLDQPTRALIDDVSPGGICLFTRNIREATQARQLLDGLSDCLPVVPLLSVDQEGGLVDRLRRIMTPMPAAQSIKTREQAEILAAIIAETLLLLGFNMNFAPVVDVIDVSRSKPNNGLYSRAFGSTPADVVELAGAFLNKMQLEGCLGCLKHFPGLGASDVDSHEELPPVNLTDSELENVDLLPYKKLLPVAKAVMIAHAGFPASNLQETDRDGKLLPSSLSYNFVTKLLRERLGFEGLVITDDLEMGAILKNYGIGEACKMAIAAGEDMLSICANSDAVHEGYNAVLNAVRSGEISEERIDTSLIRIAAVKSLISPPAPFSAERLNELSQMVAELNQNLN